MNYSQIQSVLGFKSDTCPAELWHALMCGLICAGRPVTVELLHQLLLETTDMEDDLLENESETLSQLIEFTRKQLDGERTDFELLLPDDDEGLSQRAFALTQWCDNFLLGLSAGGLSEEVKLPTEAQEFITDLAEISRVEHDIEAPTQSDEYHYSELVEYIRVGVMLLNEEFNPVGTDQQTEH